MKKQSDNQPKKKTAKKQVLTKRKGIVLISLLAVLILIVSIITTSYSWFEPEKVKATGIQYSETANFRSENCTFKTYYGVSNNGLINYNNDYEITASTVKSGLDLNGDETTDLIINSGGIGSRVCKVKANQTAYFMTEISNANANYPSNVSLFMQHFPKSGSSSFGTVGFGVSVPSNTYHKYSTVQDDFSIIRNAYIEENNGNNEGASITVEWYVKAGSSDVTFSLADMYLMYS